MSFSHGMNTQQVESLGHLLRSKGDRLRDLAVEIDRLVYSISWDGDDGAEFTRSWPTSKARLFNSADLLSGLGRSALNNASDQLHASGAGGSPVAAGSWFGSLDDRRVDVVGLGRLVSDLDAVDKSLNLLPLFGLPLPSAFGGLVGGSPEVARLMTIANLRTRVVARQLLGLPIDPRLSGSLGGHTAAAFRWLDSAPTPKVPILDVIVGAVDVGVNASEHGWGDARTIEAETRAVITTGATAFAGPVGGLVAQGGFEVGKSVHAGADAVFHITDHSFDGHLERTYGTTELTPQQAREVTQRYEGWSGLWNATGDTVQTAPVAVRDAASRGFNEVRSWLR